MKNCPNPHSIDCKMPRKSQGEKVSETSAERPVTRRSVRLSVSSPVVTPEQKRVSSGSSSRASASSASASRTVASTKGSGKKGAEAKVSTPRTGSRGRSKGNKEPEDTEEDAAEKEEQSEETKTEEKGKSLQTTRKGRGGDAKEKAEAVKTDVEDKTSTKEIASEEGEKLSTVSGRPKRGKQSAATTPVASEKSATTTTPKRCGRGRGKAAAENKEAETCSSECTLEAESSPARGVKRKRDEADEIVEEGKEELDAEIGPPKKSKTEESTSEEVEKMEVEITDETNEKEAEAAKEEKATEPVAMTVEEERPIQGVACVPLKEEESDKGTVAESKSGEKLGSEEELLTSTTSEEPATIDVKENGTTKTSKETASLNLPINTPGSEVVTVKETIEEKASPSQKTEETLHNGTDDFPNDDDTLLARKFIWSNGEEASPSNLAQTLSVVSYNILADYHAQRDYTGPSSWITKEHLSVEYRHSLLMKEIRFLDSDILCLQEVQTDYFTSTLRPALAELGYDGLHVPRHTTAYSEGEATFFRTKCFTLESSQSLVLSQVAEREIDESAIETEVKSSVKAAVDSHAVSLLTRFKRIDSDTTITCANIHVAYDKFERQDKQCLQLACAIRELVKLAGGPDKPHFICGDFNSWPDSPPYQLVQDGHLSEKSLTALQSINSVSQADGQLAPLVNYWSEGFQYPPANNLRSAYLKALGNEPLTSRFNCDGIVRSVDYIWFSGNSLDVMGVMETVDADKIKGGVPNVLFPSDHLSLKAVFGFK